MSFSVEFDVTAASHMFMIDGTELLVNSIFAVGGVAGIAETANTTPSQHDEFWRRLTSGGLF